MPRSKGLYLSDLSDDNGLELDIDIEDDDGDDIDDGDGDDIDDGDDVDIRDGDVGVIDE